MVLTLGLGLGCRREIRKAYAATGNANSFIRWLSPRFILPPQT